MAKVIAQVITATLIFFILDIRLTSLYGFFGDVIFPVPVAYLITLVTIVIITNSLNLIDGIDGLAGIFSLIAALSFGAWFFFTGNYQYSILSFALAGGILAFLFQNWEPSTIFMGDTGSLVIGTLLSILMIQFINLNHTLASDHVLRFNSSIGTAICVMSISIIDTFRIIIIRLSRNISPLKADKRHIHHALIRLNLSHSQAVYILALVQVLFIGISIALRNVDNGYLVSTVILLATVLCLLLEKYLADYYSRKGNPQIKQEEI